MSTPEPTFADLIPPMNPPKGIPNRALFDALMQRYSGGNGHSAVVLTEVPDFTGTGRGTIADAIVMNCWGHPHISGYELKVSRSDWRSEMKRPDKARRWAAYCTDWSLVITDRGIATVEELPATWGLYHLIDGQLKTIRAPLMVQPARMPVGMIVALARRSLQMGALR